MCPVRSDWRGRRGLASSTYFGHFASLQCEVLLALSRSGGAMRKSVLLFLAIGLVAGLGGSAGASPLTDRVEHAFAASGCPAVEHISPDQAIVALSAWSDKGVKQLADKAGQS